MAKYANFTVDKRDITGKKTKHLRASGVTPGVVYGETVEPQKVQAETLELERALDKIGLNSPFNLELEGKKHLAIVKKITRDVVNDNLYHVDFQVVSASDPIDAEVQLVLIGKEESDAQKAGLVIMQVMDSIEVRALPADMVQEIEVSAENLGEKGDRITLADIKLPEGVTFADKEQDLSLTIINVYDEEELAAANEAAAGDAEDESEVVAENGAEDGEAAEGTDKADQAEGDAKADKE